MADDRERETGENAGTSQKKDELKTGEEMAEKVVGINDDIAGQVQDRIEMEKAELGDAADMEETGEITQKFISQCLKENQRGDGMIFSRLFTDQFLYNHKLKTWMIFENHHWSIDVLKKHLTAVEEVAKVYLQESIRVGSEIIKLEEKDKTDGIKKKIEKLTKKRKSLWARVNRLYGDKGRKDCISYAMTLQRPLASDGKNFDSDPYLFCCNDGVVDLRTGELRDGRPDDYISKVAPVNYPKNSKGEFDLNEEPDDVLKFLFEITEDKKGKKRPEWVYFLQRLLGSTLIGRRKERIFVMLGGARGQNGKGTIKDLMLHTMGDYSWPIPSEMLLDQKYTKSADAATPALMTLIGTRFAAASETNEGKRFSGAAVKLFSGGDQFQARNNYGAFDKFWPTHTLFLLTNNPPHHSAEDRAFWHRMIKLSFEWSYVSYPSAKYERKADLDLWDKLINESDKFFGWLIRGALIYQEVGLDIPESIRLESDKYQREEDDITDFLLEKGKVEEGAKWGATDVYELYLDWYKDNINKKYEPTQQAFGRKMKNRFESKKIGTYHYLGVRALTEFDEPDVDELKEKLDELDKTDNTNLNRPEGEGQ